MNPPVATALASRGTTLTSLEPGHVHMVGIGGAGMKALAEYLLEAGWQISGSDNAMLPESLRFSGARLSLGHSSNEIPQHTDLIIYSPAIRSR